MDAIPDDLLELILLYVDSQVGLLRAASTCKRWRLIVAGDVFLRRYGSLHKLPAVAGSYHRSYERPRFEPSPHHTDVDSDCFSLDFLPENNNTRTWWRIMDSRGSVLLLARSSEGGDRGRSRDFIVCEPLTRRHQIFPAPPRLVSLDYFHPQAFLLSGGDDDAEPGSSIIGMSNFRVLCFAADEYFWKFDLFTPGGYWRAINVSRSDLFYRFIGFGSRSLYWLGLDHTVFSVDDQGTTESSSFLQLEPVVEDWDPFNPSALEITVAVGSDGEARIVLGDGGDEQPSGILKVFARLQDAGGQWAVEKSIELTPAMLHGHRLVGWSFMRGVVRGVQTTGTVLMQIHTATAISQLSLSNICINIETMEVELLPYMYMAKAQAHPTKLPWPPSLHAGTYHA